METKNNLVPSASQHWRWVAVLGALASVGLLISHCGSRLTSDGATFNTRRGPLDITVLEGGSVQAVDSQEIKCEVHVGYQGLRILKIIEEGFQITAEDIRTNKVLVELDSSEVKKQIIEQDIKCEQAEAALTDAKENYEIQINQNLSDVKAAEQKARFARMDFDKFLGDKVTQEIIDKLGIEKELAATQTNLLELTQNVLKESPPATENKPPASTSAPAASKPAKSDKTVEPPANNPLGLNTNEVASFLAPPTVVIDFSKYARIDLLGDGEAKQKLRKLDDDLQVAKKEEQQATTKLDGTKRLHAKGFVTKVELESDDISEQNSRLKVATAETARDLFIKYEFTKSAEEALSKYDEAVRELIRARKSAISKLAQAKAKFNAAQAQFGIESRKRDELREQLGKCTILAKKPGLVVYGDGHFSYRGDERVREGATIREQQTMITIPDMSKMSVRVKIHESYIKKVKKGQKVQITVDAFPDKRLTGEVTKVGVLPDSDNPWFGSDMKMYLTVITIDGAHDWLKPGMTAKVEIMVDRLANVVYVPVQAVSPWNGKQVCYVAGGGSPERRNVEIGEFNDEFIEIKSGLKEGERVLLKPVASASQEESEKQKEKSPASTPTAPPSDGGKKG